MAARRWCNLLRATVRQPPEWNRRALARLVGAALATGAVLTLALPVEEGATAQDPVALLASDLPSRITTTEHAPVPADPRGYWLLPDSGDSPAAGHADSSLARGVDLALEGAFERALPLLRAQAPTASLESYRRYYLAVALLELGRHDDADAALAGIPSGTQGNLQQRVALHRAEIALARGDAAAAAATLLELSEDAVDAERVLIRLGAALEAAGRTARAFEAYTRVYYEFPLSAEANEAQEAIERLQTPALIPPNRFELELDRAERLFSGRRWAQARAAYEALSRVAQRDDAALVALRLAQCDYHLRRYGPARAALEPYLAGGRREAEARYFHLSAVRGVGDRQRYAALVRGLVNDHPESRWAEEALNGYASQLITVDDEAGADEVFRELARRFPRGRYADRAAWKIGWRAYKAGEFSEAARVFEAAAVAFPRADYRPSWLYWAARSHDHLGERVESTSLYRVVASDYLNSYYGRLASAELARRRVPAVHPIVARAVDDPGRAVPTAAAIRDLVAHNLYGAALEEVDYARRVWGDSPVLQATAAGIRHRRGLREGAAERFSDVRGAITLMRRAYPQFMAAGGEHLPPEVLRVIFPLDYWPLIKKYSDAHGLDPYLMTALVAQESTFTADVRSAANAVGLMQIIPPTGRRIAARLGLRFTPLMLTTPETNVRLGMRYFKDLVDRFGGAHFALAGYNAGERRVERWQAERRGFAQDEFIDDIPFPETQAYVKRILGTADDYRRLYGEAPRATTVAAR